MNIRRKPSFPKYSLPNHQWLPASKVEPDGDIIRKDGKSGLVLVRVRSHMGWHTQAEPPARQRRKPTATVAADARTAIEDLSWRISKGDEAAATAFASLISDGAHELWRHVEKSPQLFQSYAKGRYTWPMLRSMKHEKFSGPLLKQAESIKLGAEHDTEAVDRVNHKLDPGDDLKKIARDLVEAIEEARNGGGSGWLVPHCEGLGMIQKDDGLEVWQDLAVGYLHDGYPDPAKIRELRELLPEIKDDGLFNSRFISRLKEKIATHAADIE